MNEKSFHTHSFLRNFIKCSIAFLLSVALLSACATGPVGVPHTFSFSAYTDSPGIEVLEYRYGTKINPQVRTPDWVKEQGRPTPQMGEFRSMPIGEELYVKWRTVPTGSVFEKTVDLTKILPKEMFGTTIEFTIVDQQLSVFVIYEKYKQKTSASLGPRRYQANQVLQVYPFRISNFD
jgi:hypothetical protein